MHYKEEHGMFIGKKFPICHMSIDADAEISHTWAILNRLEVNNGMKMDRRAWGLRMWSSCLPCARPWAQAPALNKRQPRWKDRLKLKSGCEGY
jgi:hypothetical protein